MESGRDKVPITSVIEGNILATAFTPETNRTGYDVVYCAYVSRGNVYVTPHFGDRVRRKGIGPGCLISAAGPVCCPRPGLVFTSPNGPEWAVKAIRDRVIADGFSFATGTDGESK